LQYKKEAILPKDELLLFEKNFESIPQPVFFLNRNLKILFANRICRILFADTVGQYRDKFLHELIKGDQEFSEFCEKKPVRKTTVYFSNCQLPNSTTKYFLFLNPVFDLNKKYLAYSCTLQLFINQNFNTIEKDLYYEIFNKLNVGVVHSTDGTIIDANQAFSRLTGLAKEEIMGKFSLSLAKKFCDPRALKIAQRLIRTFISGKKIEKEVIFFNNKYLQVSASSNQKTVIVQDITDEATEFQKLEKLHKVAQDLAADMTEEEYYDIAIEASKTILDFSYATIIKAEKEKLKLVRTTVPAYKEGTQLDPKVGIYGKTFRKQKSYLINDITKNNEFDLFTPDYTATISVPIGKYGVFQAHAVGEKRFSTKDLKMVELLVSHLKQALLRIDAKKKLAEKEEQYRAVFDNAGIATALFKKEGQLLLINQRFANKLNMNNKDNLKKTNIFHFFPRPYITKFKKEIYRLSESKTIESASFEAKIQCTDGKICNVICYLKYMPEGNQFLISIADITKLKLYEKELSDSIYEKNILLKEIHHRVKNNLQLISSFIRIYLTELKEFDKEAIFKEINSKINTISIVHERLYKSDSYQDISVKKYIEKLVPELISTYNGRNIKIKYDLEDIYIDLNKSIPLGLILSEVVTNSIKYAFPEDFKGEAIISISLHRQKNHFEFLIQDNGVGMKTSKKSFGHELISILTQQLNGSMKITDKQGVIFNLKIPAKNK
jgi:PAS domain S-box-containing protein